MTFAANAGVQDTAVYSLMLDNGTRVADATREGATALHLLISRLKDTELLEYFQQKGLSLEATDKTGNNLFNYAAKRGNIPMMNTLIEMGLNYKSLNKEGGNAMMFASQSSRGYSNPIAVFDYLDSLGVEADIVTYEGRTPLHNLAGGTKDEQVIDYFLEKCVNVNQMDKGGNTAFMNAIRGNNLANAEKLALLTKDINHVNKDGYSALTYAITRNSTKAVDFLLAKGADLGVKDRKGRNLVFHMFDSYNFSKFRSFRNLSHFSKRQGLGLNSYL